MSNSRYLQTLVAILFTSALLAAPAVSHADLNSMLKKMADKAAETVDKTTDKNEPNEKPAESSDGITAGNDVPSSATASGGAGGNVSTVSTKFDYVPGDKVLFVDDFKQDELGEFPARWSLQIGTFEVAEMDGERWVRCTAVDGTIRMKLPAMKQLPEFWTLEFDFYATEPMPSALTVSGVGDNGSASWEATYPQGTSLAFRAGEVNSTTPLEDAKSPAGRHHVMFMARGPALKVYMDRQRMANVPEISMSAGAPAHIDIRLWAPTGPMITNVRFAEGSKPVKDVLDSGKLVTYGIRFQTGSDVVLPESAPILRQVTAYMEAHPAVRLKITGHTDNVGTAASNLDLSKRRAASVAKVLAEQFGVAAGRFETEGKGDAQAIASNAQPEGRAMNRRVEFTKL